MGEIAADKAGTQPLAGKSGQAFTAAMEQAGDHTRRTARARKRKSPPAVLPAFEPVQLATLAETVPTTNQWMHEIKFDGYRLLAAVAGPDVRLYTRSGLDWTDKFTGLAAALAALDLPPALIDGEAVALDRQGNPSFSALQAALKQGDAPEIHYFAFDLLHLAGEDLKDLANIERKERLEALLADAAAPLHVADHVIGAGERLFHATCGAGGEGIVAKRIDAPYRGRRTQDWLKIKCTRRQEFVVIGWTASPAKGRPFGALLLAQWEEQTLVYKGKVGTGFDTATLRDLAATMRPLARKTPAATVPPAEARGAHWLRPELVAEIAFAEFTADARVRHASFLGLRTDKQARDVTPELAKPVSEAEPALPAVSHADRVLFPETGATKGDLAAYYAAIAPLMLPFAAQRPLSLVRCPQGRGKQCFFQKHDTGALGDHVGHVPIAEKDGGVEDYLYVTDSAGLRACVQMGTIEFHAWGATVRDVEAPDRMVFDLDPDESLDFAEVRRAASDIRDHLADIGLVSFALLSGGKGVHVIVPLTPGHDWDRHKDFSHRFAQALAQAEPDRFVATMTKARRKGRIFIDYLRNQRGSTAVVPYSVRARAGAPVAVPIAWDELSGMADAHPFSIAQADALLERAQSNALKGWGFAAQTLPDV
jgi:bifunctional non-homologous end joining protein LigD